MFIALEQKLHQKYQTAKINFGASNGVSKFSFHRI